MKVEDKMRQATDFKKQKVEQHSAALSRNKSGFEWTFANHYGAKEQNVHICYHD